MRSPLRSVVAIPARCLLACAVLAQACWSPTPEFHPEAEIAAAIGIADLVVFRSEADPLDAPPADQPSLAACAELSLTEATRRAVLTSPRLLAALARVRVALAASHQARTWPNPLLEFTVRRGSNQAQVEYTLSQTLLAVLQAPRRAAIADAGLGGAAAAAVDTALDVVAQLGETYTAAQFAARRVPQLERQLQLLVEVEQLVASRVRNGEAIADERIEAASQRIAAEIDLAAARREESELRLQLARQVGEPSVDADWRLDEWQPPEIAIAAEGEWLRLALRRRPDLRVLGWQLAALEDEHALAKLAPWMDLGIGVNAQRQPQWIGGPVLTLPLPLFDRGDAERERVSAEQARVRHELTEQLRAVVEQVRTCLRGFEARRDTLRAARERWLPLQRERVRRIENAHRLGEVDRGELLRAEQQQLTTTGRVLELERDLTLAAIRLQRAAGGAGAIAALRTDSPSEVTAADHDPTFSPEAP